MTKKKIYLGLVIFFIAATLVGTQNVRAHKPTSILLSYSSNPSSIDVGISHPVDDPNTHYIETVVVKVNGTTVITETYTSQPNANNFHYIYNITAGYNDNVLVTVTCVEGGTSSICLTIGVGSCSTGGGPPSIPGFPGVWVVIGISVVILLTLNYKKLRNNTTQT